MIVGPAGHMKPTLKIPFEEERTLDLLQQAFRIVSWLQEGAVDMKLSVEGKQVFGGTMQIEPHASDLNFTVLADFVSAIESIAQRSGVSSLSLVPSEIIQNWGRYGVFLRLLMEAGIRLKIASNDVDQPLIDGSFVIGYVDLSIGKFSCAVTLKTFFGGVSSVEARLLEIEQSEDLKQSLRDRANGLREGIDRSYPKS